MVAASIVIILATIVLGVGKRLKTQADEKLAKSTIQILVTAIGQYHQFWNDFPDPDNDPCLSHAENLYSQLYKTPRSKSFCEKIDATMIGDTDGDGKFEFLDPWGKSLDYKYSDGDSFPVIESGGPDGKLSTPADNISSRNL